MTIWVVTLLKTKSIYKKKKRKIKEDVFAGLSAIYVKDFVTKEI